VGDDDQSIYAFRGARVENLTEFTQEYPDVRIIRLEQNYRSCQSILTASSRLISNNLGRLGKELFTTRGKGEILRFLQTPTDYDEARYIAYEVRNQVNKGRRPCDIAVFYRMNAQSRVLEAVFTQERIPYKVVGGFRFYEREEVKDILAYLRLMMNPMDEVSLRRVANKPPRKVGEKTVDALVAATIRRGVPFFRLEELELPSSRKAAVQQFTGLLRELSEKQEDPLLLLRQLYDRSGYLEWLGSERGTERVENLQELYNALEEYLKRNPAGALADFLEEVSLNQGAGDEEFADGQVFFITLHNAKGLEFPVVFMAGMEEGIFPHFRSEGQIEDIQEERRLCYVGMTRAMEQLYLTAARERKLYGRRVEREVSCFVHEIPEELLEYREAGIPGMPAGARRFRGPGESGRFPSRPGAVAGRGASEGPVPAFPRERRRGESRSKSGENRSAGSRPAGSRPAGGRLAGNQQGPVLNQRLSDRDIERIGPGARIRHKQFGPGSVLSVSKGVADIEFADGKRMRFMLKYTPITLDREGGGSQG
jgi:DNA helicase-2/ATP-dependent DNA helicase PcrA